MEIDISKRIQITVAHMAGGPLSKQQGKLPSPTYIINPPAP